MARVGRNCRFLGGVCGLSSSLARIVRNLGSAGVGADGDMAVDNMNSISLASMLSMLLLGVIRIGPGVEMSEEVAYRGIRREGDGDGDGDGVRF